VMDCCALECMDIEICGMDILPLEIKMHIFSFLEFAELNNSKLVCKEWFFLCNERSLCNRFLIELINKGDIPEPRVCHVCVVCKDSMWIYGGHIPSEGPTFYISEVKDDIYEFSFETRAWKRFTPTGETLPFRTEHSAVIYDNKFYFFGGYGTGGYSNSLYCYDPITNTSSQLIVTGAIPGVRSAHSAVVYKNYMYIYGGWDSESSKNDLHKFDFATHTWYYISHDDDEEEEDSPFPPVVSRSHCAVVYKDSMFVFGGYGNDKHPTDIYRFNFETEQWSICQTSDIRPLGRSRSRAVIRDNKMYVFAGWNRVNYFSDLYEFDFESQAWNRIPVNFETGIGQHSMAIINDKLIIFGGFSAALQKPVNSMYVHLL